ncbi:DNA 3'-5' helicase OS=Bosea thiooxidans OX=53254 GN=ARD30_06760 PE=4 SV=1 [Bosea thiooxidans]
MREIYPGRAIRALVVYTANLAGFELAAEQLDAALLALAGGTPGASLGLPDGSLP